MIKIPMPTSQASGPLSLVLRNVEETSRELFVAAVLTTEGHLQLFRILLEHHPSVTHVVNQVPKSNGFPIPVINPQIRPRGWDRRLEAGNPLALVQKMSRSPRSVPLARHCLCCDTALFRQELAGGPT